MANLKDSFLDALTTVSDLPITQGSLSSVESDSVSSTQPIVYLKSRSETSSPGFSEDGKGGKLMDSQLLDSTMESSQITQSYMSKSLDMNDIFEETKSMIDSGEVFYSTDQEVQERNDKITKLQEKQRKKLQQEIQDERNMREINFSNLKEEKAKELVNNLKNEEEIRRKKIEEIRRKKNEALMAKKEKTKDEVNKTAETMIKKSP